MLTMIRSGAMPISLKGMSTCGAMRPTNPFCPWREANLSPSSDRRTSHRDLDTVKGGDESTISDGEE